MSEKQTPAEAPHLLPSTGVLLPNDARSSYADVVFHGWVRAGDVTYKVRVYGPPSQRGGTTKRRYTVRLTALEDSMPRDASRGDR